MGEDSKKPSPPGGGCYKKKWNKKKPTGANPVVRPEKFQGGEDELDGNHFDCTGYGQSDRFVKTVQKIADYVGQEYKCGGISRTDVMTQGVVVIPTPRRPVGTRTTSADGVITTTPPDMLDVSDYQSAKKTVDYQILHKNENQQKIFSLVWQQCTEPMHAKIRAHRDYQAIEQALNGIELLRVIKLICFNIEDEEYVPQKVHETKTAFYNLKQGKETDQAYQIRFMNTVQVKTGVKIDYNKHVGAAHGDYVQGHEEHNNSMATRTTGAIATKPTGTAQGGFWFHSLTTGRMLDRTRWTPLPMPQDVINRIAVLARQNPVEMNFTNMRNEAIYDIDDDDAADSDSDDDSDYDSADDDDDDDDYDDFMAGVDIPNNNADPHDPPDENGNVDEHQQNKDNGNEDEDDEDEDDEGDNDGNEEQEEAEAEEPINVPASLKKLADTAGALPPTLESRTRQQAQNNSETLVTGTVEEEWKTAQPLSKKKRKLERELQKQMLKRAEE
jgi:hypothetical protein